jgi:hypothetical protein
VNAIVVQFHTDFSAKRSTLIPNFTKLTNC